MAFPLSGIGVVAIVGGTFLLANLDALRYVTNLFLQGVTPPSKSMTKLFLESFSMDGVV
jgi:hypothetical protein